MMKALQWILTLMLIATAAQGKITATTDRNEVLVGETFNLVIKLDKNSSSQPNLSELNQEFRILGNSSSMSTQIINGQYSFTKSWNLVLMPLKEGTATIPAIEIDGEKTQPITIEVKKSDPNAKASGDIYIEVSTDKISAFVKEQIIFKVKLFYSMSLSEGSLSEPYASDTLISMLDKNSTYTTVIEGKRYEVIERHYALFAEKSGALEINPIIFNGRDNSSRRSMSMFSTGKPVRAVSKPISLEIKPIPQQAIGKDWLPATSVRLAESWSDQPYSVGEPITRTITLFAEGLSETQIPDIDLGEITNIRVYPEQPQTQTEITPKSIKAVKQIKMALIPTRDGTLRIPEYSLEWYNTDTGEFQQTKLPPRTLNVEAGAFAAPPIDIKQQLDDMLPVKPAETIEEAKQEVPHITEENHDWIWKISTVIFALLWVVTLIFRFKSPAPNKPTPKTRISQEISKKDVISAINAKDAHLLQRNFMDWWNKKHPEQRISNLSQLSSHLHNEDYNKINDLQESIYNPNDLEFDFDGFKALLKSNRMQPAKANQIKAAPRELPKLYS